MVDRKLHKKKPQGYKQGVQESQKTIGLFLMIMRLTLSLLSTTSKNHLSKKRYC